MSTKKKLLVSACALALICAVVVIGVFAFTSQSLSISNKITFTATGHVSATIKVEAAYYSGSTKISTIDLDSSTSNDYIECTISATSHPSDVSLPDIAFEGQDDFKSADQIYDIVYTFTVTNEGTGYGESGDHCGPFKIGFVVTDSNSTTLPSSVTRTITPAESTSLSQTARGGISNNAITGNPASLPITSNNETTITVRYALNSIDTDLDFSQSFDFLFVADDPT